MIADLATYDDWYRTPRGRWIGETEYRLLHRLLAPRPGESILDAGCGTGYFARRFRADGYSVVGVDVDPAVVAFARRSVEPSMACVTADLAALPFADGGFDCVIAVTALCFVDDERLAVEELRRVARRRLAIGLLNHRSLLWREKGRGDGQGAYTGARWHQAKDAMSLFDGLSVEEVRMATAIVLPSGGVLAKVVERLLPDQFPFGSFLAVSASPSR